ncbi:MAG: GNAT family N-acetyltransferase [Alphaproteobacteria bacterium]|nr:GNAT family N-acetyltransferase [Alphaproteobacteria bacterium]
MIDEVVRLRDGSQVRLRPIGAEDQSRLQGLLDHMSIDDIRRRFFAPIHEFSPQMSWHLSHPDPKREIAIVAVPLGREELLGVVRLAEEEDHRAEYAIVVRTDMKGHGLGYLMFQRLLEQARARGIVELWGDVLHDNDAMLQMAHELGFTVEQHPLEPGLVRVTKRLDPQLG